MELPFVWHFPGLSKPLLHVPKSKKYEPSSVYYMCPKIKKSEPSSVYYMSSTTNYFLAAMIFPSSKRVSKLKLAILLPLMESCMTYLESCMAIFQRYRIYISWYQEDIYFLISRQACFPIYHACRYHIFLRSYEILDQ